MVLSSSTSPDPEPSPAIRRLKGLLQQIIRVTVNDGRVFIGSFAGTDQALNILVINAEEYRPQPEEIADGRYVGQVVIPWRLIIKVEIEGQKDDNRYNAMQLDLPDDDNNMYF